MLPMVAIFAIHIWPVAGGHEKNTPDDVIDVWMCVKARVLVEETDVVFRWVRHG